MNSIFGIGPLELFFIAIIALVILGPERLPGVIREGMKYYRTLRNMSGDLTSQFSEELKALDDINPQKIMNEMMQDLDMEEERKALAELNPKKIRKDIADSMNPLKTTAKKPAVASTAKADAAAASAAAAAVTVAVADADDAATPEPAQSPVEDTAEETAEDTNVATPPVNEKDDSSDAPVDATVEDKPAPAVLTTAEILARSQPKKMSSSPYAKSSKKAAKGDTASSTASAASSSPESKTADLNSQDMDEPEVENRIAPDKLAANLDTATPAEQTDPAAVSANGSPEEIHEETRDSVEDGA